MSFITLNKFDAQWHPIKLDGYKTEAEAKARIIQLHAMGFTDAFYVNADADVVNDVGCFQRCKHWTVDPVTKTIMLNQVSLAAEIYDENMAILRGERDQRLIESDKGVQADLWANMDVATKAEWATYRQSLRDLPQNTPDPANPGWPVKP